MNNLKTIDSSNGIVLSSVECKNNHAKQNGGCISVTSNVEGGVPSSVMVNNLVSMNDISDRRGGAIYVGRSSLLTMTSKSQDKDEDDESLSLDTATRARVMSPAGYIGQLDECNDIERITKQTRRCPEPLENILYPNCEVELPDFEGLQRIRKLLLLQVCYQTVQRIKSVIY